MASYHWHPMPEFSISSVGIIDTARIACNGMVSFIHLSCERVCCWALCTHTILTMLLFSHCMLLQWVCCQWRQREFKVGGDEPREPTVRLPDWSELDASYNRMKSAWGWANVGQPIVVCYIRKYVIILGGYSRWRPHQPKYWGDVSPASPAALTPVFAAVGPVGRRYQPRVAASKCHSCMAFSSKCEQCRVVSWCRKLITDLFCS